ncbi:MAG: HD domain-containing protein [Oscillospiraceae bacterium]|nr:HD domain-containing protein [Oscillospiraceae bacterium]
MKPRELLDFLAIIEKLKCNTRHSWTSSGRPESVAEHSWRLAVMALLTADEFPDADINKLIKMCLIHDFGEAITGDIPAFLKTPQHEEEERAAVESLLDGLPPETSCGLKALFKEMDEKQTLEAQIFKGLDNLEALISHNEAALDTWTQQEHSLNLTYGDENVQFSPYLKNLRDIIRQDSVDKLAQSLT